MTSSFGTVVGTPRDDLPDISDTNYQATSANLSTSLNKEIDRVTDDARNKVSVPTKNIRSTKKSSR